MTFHVLILCTHNSARSVLSEGMLNHWARRLGVDVQAHSAGSAPSGRTNPHALAVLQHAEPTDPEQRAGLYPHREGVTTSGRPNWVTASEACEAPNPPSAAARCDPPKTGGTSLDRRRNTAARS